MKRPYCENCKLIWSKYASNQVKYCSRCNNPIVIKTFYPVLKIIGGIIITLAVIYYGYAARQIDINLKA